MYYIYLTGKIILIHNTFYEHLQLHMKSANVNVVVSSVKALVTYDACDMIIVDLTYKPQPYTFSNKSHDAQPLDMFNYTHLVNDNDY